MELWCYAKCVEALMASGEKKKNTSQSQRNVNSSDEKYTVIILCYFNSTEVMECSVEMYLNSIQPPHAYQRALVEYDVIMSTDPHAHFFIMASESEANDI